MSRPRRCFIAAIALSFLASLSDRVCGATEKDDVEKTTKSLQSAANIAFDSGDYEKTRKLCQRSHQLSPHFGDAYRLESWTYSVMHDFRSASRILARGEVLAPLNFHIAIEQADLYYKLKETSRLKQQLDKVVGMIDQKGVTFSERLTFINLCHDAGVHGLEQRALSRANRRKVLEIAISGCLPTRDDKKRAYDYALASLRTAKKGTTEAVELCDCCLAAAMRLFLDWDMEKLENLTNAALPVDPDRAVFHLLFATCLCRKDKGDAWRREFTAATKLDPTLAEQIPRYVLVVAHHLVASGKKQRAIQIIREADRWHGKGSFGDTAATFQLLVDVEAYDEAYRFFLRGPLDRLRTKEPQFSFLVFRSFSHGRLEEAENLLGLRKADLAALQDIYCRVRRHNALRMREQAIPVLLSLASRLQELDAEGVSGPVRDQLYHQIHSSFSALVLDSKRGNRATSQGLYEGFIEPIVRAQKRGPLPPYCLQALAIFHARCDEINVAERVLDDCIRRFPRDAMSYKLRAAIRLRLGNDEAANSDLRVLKSMNQNVTIDEIRDFRRSFESKLAGDVIANRLHNSEATDSPQYLLREQRVLLEKCKTTGQIEPLLQAAETAVVRRDYTLALGLLARAEKLDKQNGRVYEIRSWIMEALGKPEAAFQAREQARRLTMATVK